MKFKENQNSLEICQTIIRNHPEISKITLISHDVSTNWRQKNRTSKSKIKNIIESFEHSGYIGKKEYTRKDFLNL